MLAKPIEFGGAEEQALRSTIPKSRKKQESGVQVFRCSGVQVFRCSGVQVFRCSSGVEGLRLRVWGSGQRCLGTKTEKRINREEPKEDEEQDEKEENGEEEEKEKRK